MTYSATPKRRRDVTRSKFKVMGDHDEFLSRIKKTLYYGKLPMTEGFSLPVSELAAELFSEVQCGKSLQRLGLEEAAAMSRSACVSPCSLVLALLYLERLKTCNPDYLQRVAPSELFLVSMMVASKFLHDDGEEDEVFNDEWAASAGLDIIEMNHLERDFLRAIEWEVFVSEQAFWTRLRGLEKDVALREGKRRGWFSYTDLDNLLDSVDLASVAQAVLCVSAVCLTSYTASVLTLIGSALIVSHIPGSSMSTSIPTSVADFPPPSSEILLSEVSSESSTVLTPPVDILTTTFILASIGSCSGTNETDQSSAMVRCDHGKQLSVGSNKNLFINETVPTWLSDKWTVDYGNWQWWQNTLTHLISLYTKANDSVGQDLRIDKISRDITMINFFTSDSEYVEFKVDLDEDTNTGSQESLEWTSIVKNWLNQAMFKKRRQTQFMPIELSHCY